MGRSFYGRPNLELYNGSKTFAEVIAANPEAYGLTRRHSDDYAAANAAWVAAYEAAAEPRTRTQVLVAARNAAAAVVRKMAADLARIINGTPSVTDAQKMELGLAVRTKPARFGRPTDQPRVEVLSVVARSVTIRIQATSEEGHAKRGKPRGATAAWVYTYVGQAYPADPGRWQLIGASTRGKYTLTFPSDLVSGQQVWITAAWINAKQQPGPTAAPITTNLQGGGAVAAAKDMKAAA